MHSSAEYLIEISYLLTESVLLHFCAIYHKSVTAVYSRVLYISDYAEDRTAMTFLIHIIYHNLQNFLTCFALFVQIFLNVSSAVYRLLISMLERKLMSLSLRVSVSMCSRFSSSSCDFVLISACNDFLTRACRTLM